MNGTSGASREPHVLILGGGFGGVYTALELERLLRRDERVRVTLVNRDNYFLFTPMLHEVAASDLDPTHIVSPIRKLLRRTSFFEGEATAIDLENRRVTLRHGGDGHEHEVEYDQLVIALGSVTNFFGLPGLAQGALTMKSLQDAMLLRNRMIARLEEADSECCSVERGALLTFVVAGGGFAGVETIAGMNDFLRAALPDYRNLRESDLRMVLVHPGEVLLPELGPELGRYAGRKLGERGIEVRTGVKVTAAGPARVELDDGTHVPARTLLWTAGTTPHPLLGRLPVARERGRVLVDACLSVAGFPGVRALGDAAAIPDPRSGRFHPPTAQHALRQARTAAYNILAELRGSEPTEFRFSTLGQLASIGRRTGVARILGRNFSGFFAWWLWRTIYLSKLPRFEKKLRCVLDWSLDLLFSKDLVQYLGTPPETLSVAENPEPAPASPGGVAGGALPALERRLA